jgi:hypothetical protein
MPSQALARLIGTDTSGIIRGISVPGSEDRSRASWQIESAHAAFLNGAPRYAGLCACPPRSTAVPSDTAETKPTQRDRHIQLLAEKGRMGWQATTGYGKRALVEAPFHRYKALTGNSLRARRLFAQKVEARIACAVIDRMTSLGMPISQRVA